MKEVVFGVFAHPDDEAFGPSGTLLRLSQSGADVHLICATDGGSGVNPDQHEHLGAVRLAEWQATGKALGAKSHIHYGFQDGTLCNAQFHDLVAALRDSVLTTLSSYTEPSHVTFITFDPNGLSGHIDHITVCYALSYLYTQLLGEDLAPHELGDLRYFCLSKRALPAPDTHFVYMPSGHPAEEIDITETIDIEAKLAIMRLHHTQRADAEAMIRQLGDELAYEHFLLYKR